MNEPQAPEPGTADPFGRESGNVDALPVAHNHKLHDPSPVYDEADLTRDLSGNLHHVPGPIEGDDRVCFDLPPVEAMVQFYGSLRSHKIAWPRTWCPCRRS